MVHLPTLEAQREFYDKNIELLLRDFAEGYIVYYDGPHDNYKYYKTKEELKKTYPHLFDGVTRFGTNPLVIDIVEEQYKRRKELPSNPLHESWLKFVRTRTRNLARETR